MAGMSKVLTVNMTVKELNNKLNMKVNCNDETINMKMSNPFYNTGGSLYGTNVMFAIIISIFGIAIASGLCIYSINLKIDPETFSRVIDSKKTDNGEEYSVEDFEKKRRFNNIVLSVGISLFIISPVPFFFSAYLHEKSQPGAGTVMINGNVIAIITAIIFCTAVAAEMFYKVNKLDIRRFSSSDMVEDFKTWNRIKNKVSGFIRIFDVIVFLAAAFIYVIGGIKTNEWIVLSINFLIAFVITRIIRQFFELAKVLKK